MLTSAVFSKVNKEAKAICSKCPKTMSQAEFCEFSIGVGGLRHFGTTHEFVVKGPDHAFVEENECIGIIVDMPLREGKSLTFPFHLSLRSTPGLCWTSLPDHAHLLHDPPHCRLIDHAFLCQLLRDCCTVVCLVVINQLFHVFGYGLDGLSNMWRFRTLGGPALVSDSSNCSNRRSKHRGIISQRIYVAMNSIWKCCAFQGGPPFLYLKATSAQRP